MLKGLVVKDIYVLGKQLKLFYLIMIGFAIYGNPFTSGFALMYMTMLPITALAFDEQCKWNTYAQMMPYKVRDIVLCKYVIGFVGAVMIGLIEAAAVVVRAWLQGDALSQIPEQLTIILLFFYSSLVLLSINLPLLFRLGAEKGRIVYLLVTVVLAMTVVQSLDLGIWSLNPVVYPAAGTVITAFTLTISVALSMALYRKKYR